ncbi:MAG: hypothetical protein KC609_17975 [Myxococcales bacterium]|nr:hypothetical protein [Myxococcales bacterium]
MNELQQLGLAARQVGLTRTAERLAPKTTSVGPTLSIGDEGTDKEPLLRALASLTAQPFHPDLVRRLLRDGFFESCPLTGAYVAEAVLRLGVWPDDAREVREELSFFRRFCDLLYPSKGPMHGSEEEIIYRAQLVAWQVLLESGAPLGETLSEPFQQTVQAKLQAVARAEEGNDLGEKQAQRWMLDAASALPDWESHVFLVGQGTPIADETVDTHLVGAFKLAWRLRSAGLHDAAVPVLRVLHNLTEWTEIWWLLIEALVDLGSTTFAGEILERFPASGTRDAPTDVDARTTAAIRVAMAAGDQRGAEALAEPILERYRNDPTETVESSPRALLCALDYSMQKEGTIRETDLRAAFVALDQFQEWPYANRLMISASAAYNLAQKKVDEAFAMFDHAIDAMPAELSIWHTMANQVSATSNELPRVVERLVAHLARHPFLATHWDLLARLTPDADLRRALSEDFEARAKREASLSGERPLIRQRLAGAAAGLGLETAAQWLDPEATPSMDEPPLPLGTMNYLRSIDLDVPAPRFVVAQLQSGPFHRTTLVRLGQMGFFDAFPLIGPLAARECLRERSWGDDVPDAIRRATTRNGSDAWPGDDVLAALAEGTEALGLSTPIAAATWRRALEAKRRFFESPGGANLVELQWAMHTIGDPEATLIIAEAGQLAPPFGALLENVYILRLAGFLDAVALVTRALFERTNGRNMLLLAVDAELARGRAEDAAAMVEAYHSKGGEADLEEPRAARARVAIAQGDAESVRRDLDGFRTDLASDPEGAGRHAPHSVAALADADLRAGVSTLSEPLGQALAVAAEAIPRHPYIRGVQAAAGAASAVAIEADELVFADFIPAVRLMPGETSLFEEMQRVLAPSPRLVLHLEGHCRAQLSRFPYLKRLWRALAATTANADLRAAIESNLT